MLARDRVAFTIGGHRYALRPTLQATIRLESAFGMAAVLKGIAEGSATIMATIIRETADLDASLSDILDALSAPTTLAIGLQALQEPLSALVLAMYGLEDVDPHAKPPETGAKTISAGEHLRQLYRLATGWMGWTPTIALSASPAEITEAFKGHIDMLKAIHGVKEAEPEISLEEKFKGFSMSLRARPKKAA